VLVIEIKINYERIDRVLVQRVRNTKSGFNTYKIVEPKGYTKHRIRHHYDEGHFPLMMKVMTVLSENGYNPKPPYTWKELRKLLDIKTGGPPLQDHTRLK
jgi:hypothetical protein